MGTRLDPFDIQAGALLTELRLAKGLALFEMAAALGVDVETLIAFEAGTLRTPSSVLARVYALFDIPKALPPGMVFVTDGRFRPVSRPSGCPRIRTAPEPPPSGATSIGRSHLSCCLSEPGPVKGMAGGSPDVLAVCCGAQCLEARTCRRK